MATDTEAVALFRKELELCDVGPGTSLAVLSEGDVRAGHATACLAAAAEIEADAFQVNIKKKPGSFFGPGNSLQGNAPAMAALKRVDMVVDLVGLLWSKEQTEITDAGPRMLLVIEPIDVLKRMVSNPDDRRRIEAGSAMLAAAKELRITSPGGTDVTYRLGDYRIGEQYGYTDEPGRWDHWPGVFLYTAAMEEGVDGKVVIDTGDQLLLPTMRYVTDPITLTVESGMITDIGGNGLDAELMRSFMAGYNDPRAYAISHIGWGLDTRRAGTSWAPTRQPRTPRARTRAPSTATSCSRPAPNTEVGGDNDTLCHIDIPLKGCTLTLDNQTIVENGRVLPEEMRVEGH